MTARLIATIAVTSDYRDLTIRDIAEAARRLADELDRDYRLFNGEQPVLFRLPDAKMAAKIINPDTSNVWHGDAEQ